jgi:di/tricarboxylate transporter
MAPFADPIISLFFGGFALATALSAQQPDRKIAFWIRAAMKWLAPRISIDSQALAARDEQQP